MAGDPEPIPVDPSRDRVRDMLEMGDDWWLWQAGDFMSSAVRVNHTDGEWSNMVALSFPARRNKSLDRSITTLRVLMHPDMAVELAATLNHTGLWLASISQEPGSGKRQR